MEAEFVTDGYPRLLCDRCASVDWDTITVQDYPEFPDSFYTRKALLDFKGKADLRTSTCPLCKFFSACFRSSKDDLAHTQWTKWHAHEILPFHKTMDAGLSPESHYSDKGTILLCMVKNLEENVDLYYKLRKGKDWRDESIMTGIDNVFGIIRQQLSPSHPQETGSTAQEQLKDEGIPGTPKTRIAIQEPDTRRIAPRSVDPSKIDYGAARTWLSNCQGRHSFCRIDDTSGPIPGFKLIDCETKVVISAPPDVRDAGYAALSYVWGKKYSESMKESGFPATIGDSIIVCKELGLRYLWVDKYCIDQTNLDEMQVQMQQMGRIYSEAKITLIAAAGLDPDYGLPGVSTRSRRPQPQVRIGNIYILEIYVDADKELLNSSEWATRAWTYQEAVLSPRKLIFTDLQVSFICNEGRYVESLHGPLSLDGFDGFFNYHYRNVGVMEYMKGYTRRKLKYDSDSLNACLGILNGLERGNLRHLWGIPISHDQDFHKGSMMLSWSHPKPARRRSEFPSWSWAGWEGPIEYHPIDAPIGLKSKIRPDLDPKCEINVLYDDGASESLLQYVRGYFNYEDEEYHYRLDFSKDSKTPKRLQITTRFVESIFKLPRARLFRKNSQIHASLPLNAEIDQKARVFMDIKVGDLDDLQDLSALVPTHSGHQGFYLLLLRQLEKGIYTRVGIIIVETGQSMPLRLRDLDNIRVDPKEDRVRPNLLFPAWWLSGTKQTVQIV